MMTSFNAILDDRAVLRIEGKDARTLLQGLVTNDLDRLETGDIAFGALLSPQGKIQFDFFIHAREDHLLIDMDKARTGDFLKRLMLYRLRSDVAFSDVSDDHKVMVTWGDGISGPVDTRHEGLGLRVILSDDAPKTNASAEDYHKHRVSLGIPEAGKDFAFDDIFPHDAMMDVLDGVHFDKGCYVGQEVVSRVQHRSTARKRFYKVESPTSLPEVGAAVMLNDKSVGTMGMSYGKRGLSLLRMDRVGAKNTALSAGEQALTAELPDYFPLPQEETS